MSYPGGGYPGQAGAPPAGGGYPGQGGGYPGGAGAPPAAGGYPGGSASAPPPAGGGYPGQQQGYRPPGAPQGGYPGGGAPPPQQQQQGGYPAGQPGQVNPDVASWFHAVDTDRSGQITASELQRALVNGNWSHFSEEACRMMIEMFDRDRTQTINMHEFNDLFNYINQWKQTFESIDRDRSGFIEFNELTQAFQQMGYRFSPTFIQNLLAKFDPRTRRLTLDNFIVSCVQIKRLTDSFRTRDREMRGSATMQYEDFVGLAIGCHK